MCEDGRLDLSEILQEAAEASGVSFGGIFVKFSSGRGFGICAVFILTGAVLGGLLGEALRGVDALSSIAPLLSDTHPAFVLAPVAMDLFVVSVNFGFSFTPNIMSLIGVIAALVLFRRY